MAVTATARKSRLRNALEGFALTAILQSFPSFAAAALLVRATIAVTLGPSFPALA